MSWRENPGSKYHAEAARGKRVKVRLRNGMVCGAQPVAGGAPAGWPADSSAPGKGPPMRWQHDGGPADVMAWEFRLTLPNQAANGIAERQSKGLAAMTITGILALLTMGYLAGRIAGHVAARIEPDDDDEGDT